MRNLVNRSCNLNQGEESSNYLSLVLLLDLFYPEGVSLIYDELWQNPNDIGISGAFRLIRGNQKFEKLRSTFKGDYAELSKGLPYGALPNKNEVSSVLVSTKYGGVDILDRSISNKLKSIIAEFL